MGELKKVPTFTEYVDEFKYKINKEILSGIDEDKKSISPPDFEQNPTRRKKWFRYVHKDLPKETHLGERTYEYALEKLVAFAKEDLPKEVGKKHIWVMAITGACEELSGDKGDGPKFDVCLDYDPNEVGVMEGTTRKDFQYYTQFVINLKTFIWEDQ